MGRRFQWRTKLKQKSLEEEASEEPEKSVVSFSRFSSCPYQEESKRWSSSSVVETAVCRIRSLVMAGIDSLRHDNPAGLVIGTLYSHRRGHVCFAF
ncbi:hypothetical protein ZIOFF_063860 [Zingiber officinale]|uniref:Uncharacterized protein n=1 Tax=Zingiber officinale TaxID=94328 RepID=A0A8J5F5N1_ZINOF|nr:hypothetical protein ZIOFF_063860 [Zingiber officinale]